MAIPDTVFIWRSKAEGGNLCVDWEEKRIYDSVGSNKKVWLCRTTQSCQHKALPSRHEPDPIEKDLQGRKPGSLWWSWYPARTEWYDGACARYFEFLTNITNQGTNNLILVAVYEMITRTTHITNLANNIGSYLVRVAQLIYKGRVKKPDYLSTFCG